jgi:outer membrane protein OmpA-like peptidoglycan-associated protein
MLRTQSAPRADNPLPQMIRSTRLLIASALAVLLSACASTGPSAPDRQGVFTAPAPAAPGADPNAAPRPGTPGAPPATPLATEQRFLEDWFRGTPVVIAAQPPTTLQLDVPLTNSFDAGKADIKPALNAVLDRVAQSLMRHAGARITVTAPADATGPATLAQARTQRMRDSLATKGVSATRVTLVESARAGSPVQLRLSMPAVSSQPVAVRRSEGDRPSASSRGGVQPVSTQPPSVPMWTEKKAAPEVRKN